jgi:hypothetical protein
MTSRGLLRWRITLPADGRRPGGGAMPLWIQWSGDHPAGALPGSGVTIESLQIGAVARELAAHLEPIVQTGAISSPLRAALAGPRGTVVLTAPTPLPLSG